MYLATYNQGLGYKYKSYDLKNNINFSSSLARPRTFRLVATVRLVQFSSVATTVSQTMLARAIKLKSLADQPKTDC